MLIVAMAAPVVVVVVVSLRHGDSQTLGKHVSVIVVHLVATKTVESVESLESLKVKVFKCKSGLKPVNPDG